MSGGTKPAAGALTAGAGEAPDVAGAWLGATNDGAGDGSKMFTHWYAGARPGRISPTKTSAPKARMPPPHRSALRFRSRNEARRGAGRRERRTARAAGLGRRRGDVVKECLVRWGGGSARKSARSRLVEPRRRRRRAEAAEQE